MPPLREYSCSYCGHFFEELIYGNAPEDYAHTKCRCGSYADYLPSVNAAPRGSFGTVSRKLGKQSHKRFNDTVDEPDTKQLEFDYGHKE